VSIPAEVRRAVEKRFGALRELGEVGGGCIHSGHHLEAGTGELFLKFGRGTGPGFFAAEAEGLRQLGATAQGLRVPEVYACSDAGTPRDFGWIAMEWLEPGAKGSGFAVRLATGLVALHSAPARGWGWDHDGYIGTLAQDNAAEPDWPSFWAIRRLEPQLREVRRRGRLPGSEREWEMLLERLPDALAAAEEDGPSLLHGDLWGGNILATGAGEPALIDPSVYRGHREVDLAMSELFGGFDREFYETYESLRPLRPGYRELRRGIYQLYYLLVHVNLFGDGYVAHTGETLRSVVARL
jgi:fructosamine-3-kinase